ncbi:gpi-anchor transamidase [Trichoderma arundinaceum]|uniref:Gpi-anchor transamidase n=1 Tax=Trichoderma arundinaceum TaxID=490622 RepID=A0A395NPV7_TRIAR|nr:gpi-anchor transamidase [Trichoderma arundinaceum]
MKLSSLRLQAVVASALLATAAVAEHTSNWAVLVCTSRFWFNYRHLANVLSMYRTVKRLGIPDSQIILMLPDDMACNPRNAFPGTVYSNSDRAVDLYGDNIEVDYRGYEVTVENFIRLLTDRVGDETPRSKRLLTDDRSNIFVYMTGHGGNEFLKFQDAEEIGAFDLADAFEQMWEKKRYHEILFMIDTCQANTMYSRLYSPNIIATGSSELDQSSYSHHADNDVGVAVIDRYTYYNLEFLEAHVQDLSSKKTVGELFDSYDYEKIHSTAGVRYDLFPGGEEAARSRLITDFFGNIQNVEVDRAKDLALEEELVDLSKTIAMLRKREAEEDAARHNVSSVPASVPTAPPRKIQGAKALTEDDWWTKKVIGATALAGCALLWGARPLQTLSLTSRPPSPHALAWSCDAELAVATQECIYIFLPDYLGGHDADADERDASQYQFALSLQPSAVINPNPKINGQLCAQAGVKLPAPRTGEEGSFRGVGNGIVTGSGAALGQVIRVEWSPSGLGCNSRPVLMALTTTGNLITFGDQADSQSTATSSMSTRTFKNWRMLWGLGAKLSIPDAKSKDGYRNMDERIVSFSWAKEIAPGRGLLAYLNDSGQIVVMSIQYHRRRDASKRGSEQEWIWTLTEHVRINGRGPHKEATDPQDPDFTPQGSIFSLKWSPWLIEDGYRTATLAYIAKNHVGFRRIVLYGDWERGNLPDVVSERSDTITICLPLSSDALLEWEDAIWTEGDAHTARGIIATPFTVKPFQVVLNGALNEPAPPHSIWECASTYAEARLIVHDPDPDNKPPIPYYSLVRLSATPTNLEWYQSNLPGESLPQWVEDIGDHNARLVSRAAALYGVDSDFESDSEGGEDRAMQEAPPASAEPGLQVHPYRFRLWGLAKSPGDGCTAVLASRHDTQHPDRRGVSNIHFDWQVPADADDKPQRVREISKPLTTEGRVWEWMYGMGGDVPGVTPGYKTSSSRQQVSPLRELFDEVATKLPCVFCDAQLSIKDDVATCKNRHAFGTETSRFVLSSPPFSSY